MTRRDTLDATFAHQKPYAPELQRFEIIAEEVTNEGIVNAKLLNWVGLSDGYVASEHKVLVQSLGTIDHDRKVPVIGSKVWATFRYDSKVWELLCTPQGLVGGCLDVPHPGRNEVFDLHIGTWNPATNKWDYDTTTIVKGIDWRYGVPYPEAAGATGLFEARESDTYGVIYECVSLDCTSPGACGS